jgi:hypothetical protein
MDIFKSKAEKALEKFPSDYLWALKKCINENLESIMDREPQKTVLGKERFNYYQVHYNCYGWGLSCFGWSQTNSDTERNLKRQLKNWDTGIGAQMNNMCLEIMSKLLMISVKEIIDSKEK